MMGIVRTTYRRHITKDLIAIIPNLTSTCINTFLIVRRIRSGINYSRYYAELVYAATD
jgi:hypothetical protein